MRLKHAASVYALSAIAVGLGAVSHAHAQLEEIFVQAQKRAQSIQDLAISVSAFDANDVLNFGNDIGALAGQIPNVESYGNGTYIQAFFIRGIGLNEFAGNFNSPVAVHNDEVYVSKNWQAARPVFDIGRVEVLKGPQGTVFGRNTTGGAVNFYTAEPTQDFEAFIRGEADEHERFNIQGAISGALSDTMSGRFSFYSGFGSGGPQFNIFDNTEHGAPDIHQFRGQLQWDGGDTRIRLLAYGGVDQSDILAYKGPGIFNFTAPGFCPEALSGAVSFSPSTCAKFNGIAALNGNPDLEIEPDDVFTINQDAPGEKDDSFFGGYVRIEHDFDTITFTSLTSFDHYTRDQFEDSDATPIASTNVDFFNQIDQFTQELRLSGSVMEDRLNFVLGGFFQYDSLEQADSANLSAQPFNLPPANAGLPPRLVGFFDQTIKSYALFGNADYNVTDQLVLTAGLRFTREVTTVDGQTNVGLNDVTGRRDLPQTLLVPGGIDTINDDTSVANPTVDGITSNRYVDNDLSWKVGLSYETENDALLYVNAQTGFRTGGFSIPFGGVVVQYEDERVLAIEAGAKTRFFDDRVQINAAGFRTRTKDAQVNVDDTLSPLVPITRNIPEIVTWGFEADIQVAPTQALTANVGLAYLDSEITDSGGASVTTIALAPTPLQGNSPVNAPQWQLNGRIDYVQPVNALGAGVAVLASIDARWTDERFLEITNQPVDRAPSYTVVNGRIGLGNTEQGWDIQIFVRNLFNEEYLTYINNLPGVGFKLDVFGEQRTIGIAAGYRF